MLGITNPRAEAKWRSTGGQGDDKHLSYTQKEIKVEVLVALVQTQFQHFLLPVNLL